MKKAKKQLTLGKKILYVCIAIALVIGLAYLGYHLVRFTFYNEYREYLSTYEYEQGTELVLQSESLEGYGAYKLVTETDELKMYLNEDTTDVAILDKRSGEITFAAPPAADDDPVANNVNKDYLKSHVIVNFFNTSRTEGTYDSYSMAVSRDQVTFEAIENGVRVIYEMGDFSQSTGIVPLYMSIEKFEEIYAQLSETDAKSFGKYYSTNSDVEGTRQLLKTIRTNRFTLEKVEAILLTAGWTEEDYVEQMALAGDTVTVPISFKVPLEYRLEGDHVEVSVPVKGIEENGGGAIFKVQVVRNFAAAGADESGYIVVPNGDGSLIYFNNGKVTAANYTQHVYGIDPVAADYTVLESSNNANLALYAMCKENSTVLATIEDGAALASITAGVSGRVNNYNYVYTTFVIRGSETLEMFGTTGNEAVLPLVEPEPYDCNLTVRYSFLSDEYKGYSGVANYYRQRLIDEGVLTPNTDSEDLKFYYDVIAGVEMTEFFLGKQYMSMYPMTTFDEAGQISDALAEAGISNQVMNLQGWFNGGYYHDVADYIFVPWKLGGKSGLEALNSTLAENGGILYADVALQKVTFDSKRYNYEAMTSKYYSGYTVDFGQVNPVTLRQTSSLGYIETMYDLISPKFLVRYAGAFADKFAGYDVSGISLRDLGTTLHSDKKRTNMIDREAALDVVEAQLQLLAGTGKSILTNGANEYAWVVTDDIMNLPLCDNDYVLIDTDIPLYEMIVHGSIDYCGETYNLTDVMDSRSLVLNMIEYGAAPHFVFTWEESTDMKYSGLNSNYATTFSVWKDTAAEVYGEVNSALSQVTGAVMVAHEIRDDVRIVTYSNGVTIYVNYSDADHTVNGVKVPAMGYTVQ